VIVEREKVRLMEEAVRKRLERVPILKDPPKLISETAEKLIAELPKSDLPQIKVTPGDYPPCIIKLMDSVKKHENLNHQARWYLCVYLMAAGMNDDQICGIYSNLPDYSERTTRYQVEHARKKNYTPPACSTITTWGFCCADCRIGSPIYWKGEIRIEAKEKVEGKNLTEGKNHE
jgi:DNA primase large subunit